MTNTISHESILKQGNYESPSLKNIDLTLALRLYSFMLRLRRCEEALVAEYHPADEMRCPVHFCIGQEAVPAALNAVIKPDDYLYSHHRSHGYYLAKDAPMHRMFAEIYGKVDGANAGMAGSQDISYPSKNFFSGAILAGAVSIAVGTAIALQMRDQQQVVVAGFGESATDEGVFWESLNYAGLKKLPIIFICENNNYSVFSPQSRRQGGCGISERASTFGVKSKAIFGNDVDLVHEELSQAVLDARSGAGPFLLEAFTSRWCGHYGPESDDFVGYRIPGELSFWKQNCPILLLEKTLKATDGLFEKSKKIIISQIDDEIKSSFDFAKTSSFPSLNDWEKMNFSSESPLADKFLLEADINQFDEKQDVIQQQGY